MFYPFDLRRDVEAAIVKVRSRLPNRNAKAIRIKRSEGR